MELVVSTELPWGRCRGGGGGGGERINTRLQPRRKCFTTKSTEVVCVYVPL